MKDFQSRKEIVFKYLAENNKLKEWDDRLVCTNYKLPGDTCVKCKVRTNCTTTYGDNMAFFYFHDTLLRDIYPEYAI